MVFLWEEDLGWLDFAPETVEVTNLPPLVLRQPDNNDGQDDGIDSYEQALIEMHLICSLVEKYKTN